MFTDKDKDTCSRNHSEIKRCNKLYYVGAVAKTYTHIFFDSTFLLRLCESEATQECP